ncbi:MAG: hypothetical protein ACOYKZ_05305 [Chlamydiia bacterium]
MTTSSIGAFSRVSPPGNTPSPPPSQTLLSRASISFQGLSDSTVLYAESRTQPHLLEKTPQELFEVFLEELKVPENPRGTSSTGPIIHPGLAPIRSLLCPEDPEKRPFRIAHRFMTAVAVGLLVAAALVFLVGGPVVGPSIASHLFGLSICAGTIAEIAHLSGVRVQRDTYRSRPPAEPLAHVQAIHKLSIHARPTLALPVEGQPRAKPVIGAKIAGQPQRSPVYFCSSGGSMNSSISEESLPG